MLVGVQVAVKPMLGVIVLEIVRVPFNPLKLARVTVEFAEVPEGNVRFDGFAVIEKSGGTITLTVTETACDRDPMVPVTVTV